MITIELQGGLGNQLFQIFTLINYALINKQQFMIPYEKKDKFSPGGSPRPTYWDTLFSELKNFLTTNNTNKLQILGERQFSYQALPLMPKHIRNIKLYGYFQSPKYFDLHFNNIVKLLKLREKQQEIKNKFYSEYNSSITTISMHFRIGDYVTPQAADAHPVQNCSFYIKSLRTLRNKLKDNNTQQKVIYFCEDEDVERVMETINKLVKGFPMLLFERCCCVTTDWEQLLYMSLCDHNIIANSSFSWWAAYLNENTDKIVCYPKQWFGEVLNCHDTSDLLPEDWIKIIN